MHCNDVCEYHAATTDTPHPCAHCGSVTKTIKCAYFVRLLKVPVVAMHWCVFTIIGGLDKWLNAESHKKILAIINTGNMYVTYEDEC